MLLSLSFLSQHLMVFHKFGVHFHHNDVRHSWKDYIYSPSTLYSGWMPIRNYSTYLGIDILQSSPILPNFTWAFYPKPTCYQTAPFPGYWNSKTSISFFVTMTSCIHGEWTTPVIGLAHCAGLAQMMFHGRFAIHVIPKHSRTNPWRGIY